jgi:membrane-bound serine protease (ClpP class)
MDSYLIWSLVLFLVGALIAVIEVIVPSGGLLAVAALAALGGSLYCAYQLSGWMLAAAAVLEAVSIPALVVFTLKVLPRTSMGKSLMLSPPASDKGPAGSAAPRPPGEFDALLGHEGRAVTMLRPSGTAEIDGKRVSVVTSGEMIGEGARVRVAMVEGNRVVVEAIKA